MSSASQRFDLVAVGAGPAGLAAAACAAESGLRTAIVDDNASPGGQIWRGKSAQTSSDAANWVQRVRQSGVVVLSSTTVIDQPSLGVLLGEGVQGAVELKYSKLVIATGARERFLPFPGWTLPNVMGAGGLQAMVKSGLPVEGKKVVVAGSGPLLPAVAAYLRRHGAMIRIVCEQASWAALARFAAGLPAQPGKLWQGLTLGRELLGVRFAANSWPVAAEGKEKLEAVVISRNGARERIACDFLACGFHLVANTELAALLGCQIHRGYVVVDDLQQTSSPGIYCAGEPTGIGGVELALVEGQIAGLAAAGRNEEAAKLSGERKKLRKFARLLDQAFSLRGELRSLPAADTIVCRCEDVTCVKLRANASWHAAKLQTRCGMGPCQGRVCGPATQFLFKWTPDSVRPPVFPARVETLAAHQDAVVS